jgi:Glyoxalase/Bleomycin resistance protein/Dioxygenase superfamily
MPSVLHELGAARTRQHPGTEANVSTQFQLNFERAFHIGVRVEDLQSSMDELGKDLGLQWCSVQEREQHVWTPDDGARVTKLRFTYSNTGPLRVELLQGTPGAIWDAALGLGVHHTGVWVADVAGETERLASAGWTLLAAKQSPQEGYGAFSYLAAPSGFVIELVDDRALPRFELWWAGGDL